MFTHWDRELLLRINAKLDLIFGAVVETTETEMATIQDLIDTVAQQSTVIDGATAAIDGLRERLEQAGVDPAKLDELKAQIEENTGRLAAAIARNTDADDEVHASQM